MIIKQLYLWRNNSDWSDKDFNTFGIVIISIVTGIITGVFGYWAIAIFGPWFSGAGEVYVCAWGLAFLQQLYFWGRFARYANLRKMGRMKSNGEIVSNSIIKRWILAKVSEKETLARRQKMENDDALRFANNLRK